MGAIEDAINAAFRDYVTDGVPATGAHEPDKSEIRAIGDTLETAMAALANGVASVIKTTKALLDADLAHAANTVAIVYADPTPANNDVYIKVGGSGAGSWTLTSILGGAVEELSQPYLDEAAAAVASAESFVDSALDSLSEAGVYSPAHSFRAPVTKGHWYRYRDRRQLFTDTARTDVNVIKNVGEVAKGVTDLSGFDNHQSQATTGFAPTFARSPYGLYGLYWDGTDDYLESVLGPLFDIGGPAEITVVAAIQADAASSRYIYAEVSNADNDPLVALHSGGASATGFGGDNGAELKATITGDSGTVVSASVTGTGEVAFDNVPRVVSLRGKHVGGDITVEQWIDDRLVATATAALVAVTTNKAATGALLRGVISGFYLGYNFEQVGVNRWLPDAELLALQTYMVQQNRSAIRGAAGAIGNNVYPAIATLRGRLLVGTSTQQGAARLADLSLSPEGFRRPAISGRRFGTMNSHYSPSVMVLDDDRAVIINAFHDGNTFSTSISDAGDLSSWPTNRDEDVAGMTAYAYPRHFVSAGVHYLMMRARTDAEADSARGLWRFSTADIDNVFGSATKYISGNRPYGMPNPNGNRVDWIISTGNPGDGGPVNDLFHCYQLLAENTLHKSDDTSVALPAATTALTSLHSQAATGLEGWVAGRPWNGLDGKPRVIYWVFNLDGSISWMFRRWTGAAWTVAVEVARSSGPTLDPADDADNYIAGGGYCADPLDPNVVYLTRNVAADPGTVGADAPHQVWRYVTADNGATWTGTQLTFEEYPCTSIEISPERTEPRLVYETGPATGYDNFGDVRVRNVHSLTGRDDVL